MKYARQTQDSLDRFDISLRRLRDLIKRGETRNALQYMEEGELKERFEELRSLILASNTGNLHLNRTHNDSNAYHQSYRGYMPLLITEIDGSATSSTPTRTVV